MLNRRFRLYNSKRDEEESEKQTIESIWKDSLVPVLVTGGDLRGPESFLTRRVPEHQTNVHVLAARGALKELRSHPGTDVNGIDEAHEYGSLLAAAARSGSAETV